jgi:hypothetical protein
MDYNMEQVRCMLDNYGYRQTHNTKQLLPINGNNGYTNSPECYVKRTSPVLFKFCSRTKHFSIRSKISLHQKSIRNMMVHLTKLWVDWTKNCQIECHIW